MRSGRTCSAGRARRSVALGPRVERLPVADSLTGLIEVHLTIHEYEFVHHLAQVIEQHWDQLSPTLQPIVKRGQAITKDQYEDALAVEARA